jgi:hypothetical protein
MNLSNILECVFFGFGMSVPVQDTRLEDMVRLLLYPLFAIELGR